MHSPLIKIYQCLYPVLGFPSLSCSLRVDITWTKGRSQIGLDLRCSMVRRELSQVRESKPTSQRFSGNVQASAPGSLPRVCLSPHLLWPPRLSPGAEVWGHQSSFIHGRSRMTWGDRKCCSPRSHLISLFLETSGVLLRTLHSPHGGGGEAWATLSVPFKSFLLLFF